jgi:hypothetical protein
MTHYRHLSLTLKIQVEVVDFCDSCGLVTRSGAH